MGNGRKYIGTYYTRQVIFTLIHKGIVISKVAFEITAYKYLKDMGSDLVKGIVIIGVVSFILQLFPGL